MGKSDIGKYEFTAISFNDRIAAGGWFSDSMDDLLNEARKLNGFAEWKITNTETGEIERSSEKTLFVDRSKWLRGKGTESSFWKDDCGCIIGLLMISRGMDKSILEDRMTIGELTQAKEIIPELFQSNGIQKPEMCRALNINDNENFTDESRESQLKFLFSERLGLELSFYN